MSPQHINLCSIVYFYNQFELLQHEIHIDYFKILTTNA